MTVEAIFTEALALPADQRAKLAEQLRHSLNITPLPSPIPGPEVNSGDHPLFDERVVPAAEHRQQREIEEAIVDEVRAEFATRLGNGTPFIDPPVPQRPSPVAELPLDQNPLWPDFLAAVEEYRNQRDAEDRAAHAAGN